MPEPTGYAHSHERPCSTRGDCVIGVGFDRLPGGDITRFLVDLQHLDTPHPPSWTQIARIDHNPSAPGGHDIRSEGIHVDARRKEGPDRRFTPHYSHIPAHLDAVVSASADYLDQHAPFFVAVYEGNDEPETAPSWSP